MSPRAFASANPSRISSSAKRISLPLAALACASLTGGLQAQWTQPIAPPANVFPDLPSGLSLAVGGPGGVGIFTGSGPYTLVADTVPHTVAGLDVWNFELTSLVIPGTINGFNAEVRAGFGQGFPGFAPLTKYAAGQFTDGGSDGILDFPASTIGDMFFDMWIDFSNDGVVDIGEVISNDTASPGDVSAKMFASLTQIPPDLFATAFNLIGGSDESDPNLYTFDALPAGPIVLSIIEPSTRQGQPVVFLLNAVHNPEVSTAAIPFLGLVVGAGAYLHRRRRNQA